MAVVDSTRTTKVLIAVAICLCILIFTRSVRQGAGGQSIGNKVDSDASERAHGIFNADGDDDDEAEDGDDDGEVEHVDTLSESVLNDDDESEGDVMKTVKTLPDRPSKQYAVALQANIETEYDGHKKPFNFIHIPKTAGETMESTFGLVKSHRLIVQRENDDLCSSLKSRCMGICACDRFLSSEDRRYWISRAQNKKEIKVLTFTIVRNPFDRTVSWYYFCISGHGKKGNLPNPQKACQYARDLPFDDWVETVYMKDTDSGWGMHKSWSLVWNQAEWLKDEDGHIDMSTIYVGRYETLEDSIEQAEKLMGGKKLRPIPHKNPSSWPKGHDYRTYYSEKSRKIIEQVFAEDLKLFDYSF